jgi:RHS repeat-associated protein
VDYAHDHFLNLERQVKNVAGTQATEVFTYDDLQRILTASRSWTGGVTGSEADAYTYDDLGNVASKSDKAALYLYGDSSRSVRNAGPHAVKELRNAQNGTLTTYTYDLNGNMTAGDGRTVDVDLMDRPTRVCSGTQCTANPQLGTFTDFAYAPDGARYRQKIWASPGPVDSKYGAKTVYYVDKDYELVVWADQQTEERTYVGGSVVLYRAGGGARQDRYQHLDRLGSVDAVTDGNAQKVMLDLHGYDPFGKPRGEPWTSSQERLHPAGDRGATTDRGFTGHEHLDLHYLTHMNGRMYDYRLGRFLSVDPIISNPLSSQSVNPYSYIGNNPLSGTDPTGYESVSTGCGSFAKCDVTFYHPSPSTIALYTPSNYSNGSVGHTTQVQNTNTTDAQGPQKIAQQHKGDELAKNEKEKPIRLAQVRGGGRRRSPAEPRVAGLPPENIEEIVLANRMQRAVERIESRGQRFDTVRDPTKPLAPAEVERAERMANLVDPPPTVKVPNRWGSRGSPAHREVIEQRIEELRKAGHELKGGGPLPEEVVPTPGGAKSMRRPDITTQTPDGSTHRENVGRTTKAGEPVARERRALDDIERATGKRPDYTPYDR